MATLIFDFDGTLTDFRDHWGLIQQIINTVLARHGIASIPPEEFKHMRDHSLWHIVRQAGIPFYKLPVVLRQVQQDLREQLPLPHLYPGIQDVLKQLHNSGVQIGIVTSNVQTVVDRFLAQNDLTDNMAFSHASSNVFGKHRELRKILRQYSLNPQDVWYIGDEIRDIKAARKAGIKIASVVWGLNTQQALARYQPDRILHKPEELLTLIA